MRAKIIALILIAIGLSLTAQESDTLKQIANEQVIFKAELKNGTILTGTILSENDSILVMDLEDLGEIIIQKRQIRRLISYEESREGRKSY